MIDFEFEFQYAEAKLPILRQVGGGIPAGTLRGALRRQRMRKIHAAAVHQWTDTAILRGRAKRLLPLERAGHRWAAYRRDRRAGSIGISGSAKSVFLP